MQNLLKTLGVSLAMVSGISAYAAPPTIMVLPDKVWCNSQGYVETINANGKQRIVEDYGKAFLDSELKNVTTAINSLMQDRNFPLKDYAAQDESDDDDDMFDEAFSGAESGSEVQGNAIDQLLQKTRPDILLRIGWDVNKVGFQYNLSYRLEAVDAYSNKAVASVTGESAPTARTTPVAACLKQAAADHIDEFAGKLMSYFDDVQTNGREIRVLLRIIDNGSGLTFNQEYGGKELSQIIYDWMSDNTVSHQFNERTASRNRLAYDQVRIPLKDSNGRPMQARQFVAQLQRYLASAPYSIRAENSSPTLGVGRLMLGEK